MRQVAMFCAVLLVPVFSVSQVRGQASVEGGYASTWVAPPGAYAVPVVPLIQTPTYDFGTPSLQVGASDATAGNVAGAANSTQSTLGGFSGLMGTAYSIPGVSLYASPSDDTSVNEPMRRRSFDLGAANFEGDFGAAELASNSRNSAHAAKTYTNDDLNRVNQNNGEVKFNNKTEHID
jgi:hypothetical protein